ncbi:MAG: SRPBCC family protein [Silvibacterium sp.]|nr:SRPBCC family protein [Silvibacterium sp.]
MNERTVMHSTFEIERDYPVPPEKVFAAFADPVKKQRWFREEENRVPEKFEMDFRVGGRERSQFRITAGPVEGAICSNDTTYLDIVPNSRIVLAYTMALGEKRFSSSLATFQLLAASAAGNAAECAAPGTKLVFTEQAAFFEGADGPEMRKGGWELLLERLAHELREDPA